MVNLIYEVSDDKYFIGNINGKLIKNKMFYYGKLENIEYDFPVKFFLADLKFKYKLKTYSINLDRKFTISDLESYILLADKGYFLAGYVLFNVKNNGENSFYLLGKQGNLEFSIGCYYLHFKYRDFFKKIFGNQKISIYPTSLGTISCVRKIFQNGVLIYLLEDRVKLIKLVNGFYGSVEELDIGLKQFHNWILETFHKEIDLFKLNEFQLSVYEKQLDTFLEPISLFIKNNLVNENVYVIGSLGKYPKLVEKLGNFLKLPIRTLRLDNKVFNSLVDLDLYCLQKN